MALTQITGVWEHGGEGQVACPIQANLQGLGMEWGEGVGEESGLGGVGVPSLQAMASFPSSTQTAAGTGWGLLLKHWWLQAAGEGWRRGGLMVRP